MIYKIYRNYTERKILSQYVTRDMIQFKIWKTFRTFITTRYQHINTWKELPASKRKKFRYIHGRVVQALR